MSVIQPQPGTPTSYLTSASYPALMNFINTSQLRNHFSALWNYMNSSPPTAPIQLSKFQLFVSGLNDNIRITFYNNNNVVEGSFYLGLPTGNNNFNYTNKKTIFNCFDYVSQGKLSIITTNPGEASITISTFFEINGKSISLCNFLSESYAAFRGANNNSYSNKSSVVSTECSTCIPQTVLPVICPDKKAAFINFMTTGGSGGTARITNYTLPQGTITDFCDFGYQYISSSYIDYLTKLNVTSLYNVRFITIAEFGQTYLHYGFNGISNVIDQYKAYYDGLNPVGQPENSNTLTWNQWVETIFRVSPTGKSICPPAALSTVVSPSMPIDSSPPCQHMVININEAYSQDSYNNFLFAKKQEFIANYIKKGIEMLNENLTMTYYDQEYQYTLYYYDQAGNLTQTVAPEGVKRFTKADLVTKNSAINAYKVANSPLNSSQILDQSLQPLHDFKTQYRYNSLNQLVWQVTPDGGETRFAYDKLGRIIASQNANQVVLIQNNQRMSFTTYDEIGRINQAGEVHFGSSSSATSLYSITSEGKLLNCIGVCNEVEGFNDLLTKTEVTRTVYDEDPDVESGIKASSLFTTNATQGYVPGYNNRNRVTGVFYHNQYNTSNLFNYDNAIFYNYDVHGNVKELINYNSFLKSLPCNSNSIIDVATGQKNDCDKHIKRVVYDYDLISGNVNKLLFQPNKLDQFIHRYNYDADNRIVNVETSPDGAVWEKDASYSYYSHGSLSRVEIGNKKVQGTDYAYTLQGWLKAVNGENISTPQNDMGQDGVLTGITKTRDAFGYSLNYYDGDYKAVFNDAGNTSFKPLMLGRNIIGSSDKNLYNGNIKQMITNIKKNKDEYLPVQKNNYTYDQLNRIKRMTSVAITPNVSGIYLSPNSHESSYSYDKNGNLLTMRNTVPPGVVTAGGNTEMDNFTYKYAVDASGNRTNKLNKVFDSAPNIPLLEDIKNNISELPSYSINSQNTHNYIYDKIGQLTEDKSEKLLIKWRVDGKVKEIIKNQGLATQSNITFGYDGLGNRISKSILKNENQVAKTETSFYSKDVQGNTLAVYKLSSNVPNVGVAQTNFNLKEHHLFGSSRIGLEEKDIRLYNQVPIPAGRIAVSGAQPQITPPPAVSPFLDYSLNVNNTTMATWPMTPIVNSELENFKFETNIKLLKPLVNPDGDLLISKLEYKGIKNISSNAFVNISLLPSASSNNCLSVATLANNTYNISKVWSNGCASGTTQNGNMQNIIPSGGVGELSFNYFKIAQSTNPWSALVFKTDRVGLNIGGIFYGYNIEKEGTDVFIEIENGTGTNVIVSALPTDLLRIKRTATTVEFYKNSSATFINSVPVAVQTANLSISLGGNKFAKINNLKISFSSNINAEITNIVKLAVQKTGPVYQPKLSITQFRRDTASQATTKRNIEALLNPLTAAQLAGGLNLTADFDMTTIDGNASFGLNGFMQYVGTSNWTTESPSTPSAIPAPSNNQIGGTITGYNPTRFDMCYFNYNINQTATTFSNQFNFDLDSGLALDTAPVATDGTLMTVTPAVVRTLGPCLNDTDQDGLFDIYELNQLTTPLTTIDTDSDGQPNYLDVDDDGDGIKTQFEKADLDLDKNPFTGTAPQNTNPLTVSLLYTGNNIPDYLDIDDDGDGYATWETLEGGPGIKNTPTPGVAYTKNFDSLFNTIPDYLDYSNRLFLTPLEPESSSYFNIVGDKRYELSNHLGNVLVVINDKKIPLFNGKTGALKSFNNDILSYSDYYPFGSLIPGRHENSASYRYGFQGQEKDDELKGEGNSLNYTFRMHDPRIGRFFAVDPLFRKYPYLTPYQFSSNQPIHAQELEGLESKAEFKPTAAANLTINIDSKGKFGFKGGLNVGLTVKDGDVMGSVGVSASTFNIGLGSNHMSTGNHDTQYNITGSIGTTIGYGLGNELPLNAFTKKTDSGMMNSYKSSITFGQNITFNSEGNNQRVSSVGFKAGDFSLYTYNDMIGNGYKGDGGDRFDSGGGNLSIFNGSGTFTFGTNVFTGDRIDAKPGQKSMFGFGLSGSNPTGGAFGTYSQSARGQSQTSGMTYYNFRSVLGCSSSAEIYGRSQMWSQNAIHLYLVGNPLFYSTANDVYLNPNK